jgi:protein-disulfide isomerase
MSRTVTRGSAIAAMLVLLLAVTLGLPGRARAEDTITRTQADAMLNELRQIRGLLERLAAPSSAGRGAAAADERVTVGTGTMPALGRDDATLTIVEFTDLQCPYCQRFHLTAFEQIKKNYVDTGKVRFVSRDLPLPMHENAMSAAHAARCAGEQGKLWEMRHALIVNASQLGAARYTALGEELGLDMPRFQACVSAEKYQADIEKDVADAEAAGVNGTPTFVIGRRIATGIEGVKVIGALPYAAFDAKLKQLLAQ